MSVGILERQWLGMEVWRWGGVLDTVYWCERWVDKVESIWETYIGCDVFERAFIWC